MNIHKIRNHDNQDPYIFVHTRMNAFKKTMKPISKVRK